MRHESEKALHEALMMQSELEQRANNLEVWQQNAEVQERKLAEVQYIYFYIKFKLSPITY